MPSNSPFVISFLTPHQSMLGDLARPLATWLGSTLHLGKGARVFESNQTNCPNIFFSRIECNPELTLNLSLQVYGELFMEISFCELRCVIFTVKIRGNLWITENLKNFLKAWNEKNPVEVTGFRDFFFSTVGVPVSYITFSYQTSGYPFISMVMYAVYASIVLPRSRTTSLKSMGEGRPEMGFKFFKPRYWKLTSRRI